MRKNDLLALIFSFLHIQEMVLQRLEDNIRRKKKGLLKMLKTKKMRLLRIHHIYQSNYDVKPKKQEK